MVERRDPPPPLEFALPDCPICEQTVGVDVDGYLVCEDCDASWTKHTYDHGEHGEWTDPDVEALPQCDAERWATNYVGVDPWRTDRCVLVAGHDYYGHLNGEGYRFDVRTRAEAHANHTATTKEYA